MKTFSWQDPGFEPAIRALELRGGTDDGAAEPAVREILAAVRAEGDAALLRYTEKFDGARLSASELELPASALKEAERRCDPALLAALRLAHERIVRFHEKELRRSWHVEEEGVLLGQRFTPVARAGLYVPGGKAAYPSSVLMTAAPAKVAGVGEVVMATPAKKEGPNPVVLAAASIAGVDRVFRIGGAQAIAALAYGTETVPRVDKIVGPGNIYVATAKRLVLGQVSIDSIAGPSEILVITDGSVPTAWIAADLLSQAEHDEMAIPILVTTDAALAARVPAECVRMAADIPNEAQARASLAERARIFVVRDLAQAAEVSNRVAPEHLELAVRDPEALLPKIVNAGAIFLGAYTPEAVGDYVAGPNHVLPTGGTARFFSPLGVDDFQKKSSLIGLGPDALRRLAGPTATLARSEGLAAHAMAVELRAKEEA